MTFEEQLELGHLGEALVVDFLKSRHHGIVPSYDFSGKHGEKAPRLQFSKRGLVIPDLDVCRDGRRDWLEVKTYHHAHLNRTLGFEIHGIDKRLIGDYRAVEQQTGSPVFIAVLEVTTGELLVARLSSLQLYDCMCKACRSGSRCRKPLQYFARSAMQRIHVFADASMSEIRTRWPEPASARPLFTARPERADEAVK